MMPLPRGPSRKIDIVKILEVSPGSYKVWPRSGVRSDEEFTNLLERLKTCLAEGDAIAPADGPWTVLLTTSDIAAFKKRLMAKGIVHE